MLVRSLCLNIAFSHILTLYKVKIWDVTKISSCRVNTTSRQGIKQLGISFGSICLLFSYATSQGHVQNTLGVIPRLMFTSGHLYLQ